MSGFGGPLQGWTEVTNFGDTTNGRRVFLRGDNGLINTKRKAALERLSPVTQAQLEAVIAEAEQDAVSKALRHVLDALAPAGVPRAESVVLAVAADLGVTL